MTLSAGQTLTHYEILGPLGAGGMGEVYRARDTRLDREVAIKVLPEDLADDLDRMKRFEREAKTLASLSHANVAHVYGMDQVEDTCFIAMELVPGEDLAERLARGPLPIEEALDVARQIAEGLEAAHEAGVVHRDLKPANVHITPSGLVKVLDFGLAKPIQPRSTKGGTTVRAESDSFLATADGVVLGTPTYMSPEQARGKAIDRRTDVWAFGCVLFECLTGARAFQGETLGDVLASVLEREPDWKRLPAGTPTSVREVLARCLVKEPRGRLRDVGDAGLMLAGVDVPAGANAGEAHRPERSRPLRIGGLALVAIVALAFVGGWFLRPSSESYQAPRVTQLTFSGADHQPHVSPDGRLITFTSSRNGISQIWLRQLEGGGEQPLTAGPDWRPRFTPDGQALTFIRKVDESYSAYRVPVVGGQPRKLIDSVTEVDTSPDGRQLAFVAGAAFADEDQGGELGILDLETGEKRILQQMEGWDLFGLRWSPDGKRLCVSKSSIQGGAGQWRPLLIDPESGELQELSISDTPGLVSSAAWAGPDALVLAVSPTAVSSTPEPNCILRYDLERGEERVLFWAQFLFPFRGSLNPTAQLSLVDDQRLVFDQFMQSQTLVEVDLETGLTASLAAGVSVDRQPTYHPDGSRVLFTSNRSGNVDLFSFDPTTKELLRLTDHEAGDWDGAYTPDGKSILWSSERTGNFEIWIADLDGTNARQVTRDAFSAENPTMTPDGQWVVYSTGHPEHPGIYKIRTDGTQNTVLAAGNWVQPDVSPDGRYALYVGADNARLRNVIRVLEIETGKSMPFESNIDYDLRSPNVTYGRGRWLPDGSGIVFVGIDEQGATGLWVQDFDPSSDTGATRRRFTGFDGALIHESFGISPDGKRVTLSAIDQVLTIHLVDLLPKLR